MYNKIYDYNIYLCDFKKNIISAINYSNIQYTPRFDDFNELEFSVELYENGILRVKDKNYDLTKAFHIVYLEIKNDNEIVHREYFTIDNPNSQMNNDGIFTKSIHCFSNPYATFQMRKIRSYTDQVRTLYDPNNSYSFTDNTKGGIINLLRYYLYNSWSVGYINPQYLGIYHTFTFSDNTFIDIIRELEKAFVCYIFFDSVNNLINIYSPEEVNNNSGLVISHSNYAKSVSTNTQLTGLCTRLSVFGKDNTTIAKYNITGQLYLEDYSYFYDEFSAGLKTAMDAYNSKKSSKVGTFTNYLNQLDTLNSTLNVKNNELKALNAQSLVLEDSMNGERNKSYTNTSSYNDYYDESLLVQSSISSKQSEINSIQSQIDTINNNIKTLNDSLRLENNFTQEQLVELSENFIKEETLNLSSCSDSLQLYNYALKYLEKKSKLPISIDLDSIDIFSCNECQDIWNKIKIGDLVYVDINELGYDYTVLRLVSYNHNKFSNSFTITLSNTNDLNIDLLKLNNIFKLASQTSNTVVVNQDSYNSYTKEKNKIIYNDTVIQNDIKVGNMFINRRGFIGSDIGAQEGSKIQIYNDKICITTNNWRTYHTLLSGNGLFLQTDESQTVIHKDYGFAINVWNPALQDYRNAIYLGLHSGTPALFIDNGFISLTRIYNNQEVNRIFLDPEVGIKIQAKDGNNWVDRLYADTNGNLIAEKLRTFGDGLNYVELDKQYINFWNSGQSKLKLGFEVFNNVAYPYSTWGIGSGVGDVGHIAKFENEFYMSHSTNNGLLNKISFMNNSPTYGLGGIVLGNAVYFTNAYVNFSGANVVNLDLGTSGTFETVDGKEVTVSNGCITRIETI